MLLILTGAMASDGLEECDKALFVQFTIVPSQATGATLFSSRSVSAFKKREPVKHLSYTVLSQRVSMSTMLRE